MAVLGINYTKLDVDAKNIPYANLSINTTPKIEAVNKTQIQTGKNAIPILVVDFSFNSVYFTIQSNGSEYTLCISSK